MRAHTVRGRVAGASRLVGILVALAIPPAALTAFIGNPLPSWPIDVPSAVSAIRAGLVPSSVWVSVLAVGAWVVYGVLVGMLALEVLAVVRNRPSPAGVPSWVRRLAQVLVSGAVALAGSAQPIHAAATAGSVPPTAMVTAAAPAAQTLDGDPVLPPVDGGRLMTVSEGDTWAGFSADLLGDPTLGQQLRDANLGRQVGDGHTITGDTAFVEPGWPLLIPTELDSAPSPDPTATAGHPDNDAAGHAVEAQSGDHFWSIAESAIEDAWNRTPSASETASYWVDVVEANRDRLAPPHDPDLIYPGQEFVLPPIPTDPTLDGSAAADVPSDSDAGSADRGQPDGAADAEGPADHPGQDGATDADLPSEESPSPNGADLATEGDFAMPPPARPLPQPGHAAPPTDMANRPSTPATGRTQTHPDADDGSAPEEQDDSPDSRVLILGGVGIAAAGVIAVLRRLRTERMRRRQPGTAPPTPPPTDTEPHLHAAATPEAMDVIDRVLRDLASTLDPQDPPQIAGAHYTGQTLTVLLDEPATPPDGWEAISELEWVRHLDQITPATFAEASHHPGPLPTLVTIGHSPDGILLLNLEHLTVTELSGPASTVVDTMATAAVELATSPMATDLRVVCLGFADDLASFGRIDVVAPEAADGLLAELATLVEETLPLAANRPAAAPALAGRIDGLGDSWLPTVVFDPTGTIAERAAELARQIPRAGLAVVAGNSQLDAEWHLEVDDHAIRVLRPDRLELTLPRQRTNLTSHQITDIGGLVAHARSSDDITYPDLTTISTTDHHDAAHDTPATAPAPTTPAPVQVRVLGTVGIDGIDRAFRRAPSLELVGYLALHPRGVTADTLMEALWPSEPPDNDRLNRVTSDARTTLGTDPDGQRHLPRIDGGLYRLAGSVDCDLHRFHQLVEHAKQPDDDRRATLQAALELVAGEPFSGTPRGWGWAHSEGHVTAATVAIDEAARTLAELCLADDDIEGARWATTRGLAGAPGSIGLYKLRLRIAAACASLVEADAVMDEARAQLTDDDGPEFTDRLLEDLDDLYAGIRRDHIAV